MISINSFYFYPASNEPSAPPIPDRNFDEDDVSDAPDDPEASSHNEDDEEEEEKVRQFIIVT